MWTCSRRNWLLLVGTGAACLTSASLWWYLDLVRDLPDRATIAHIRSASQATVVFDGSDRPASTIFKQERVDVPLEQVSADFVRALVSVEDRRFYSHGPIDSRRIVSAAFSNLLHLRARQGASTLTQQLARATFLTPRRTLRRKWQEIILARQIEQQYSKSQILELYANRVYFGNGLWGIEAASLGYFGKHASELTLAEAALIAGLVKSPSSYAPTTDMAKAINRRNTVLRTMFETGAIDAHAWQRAREDRIVLHDALAREAPYGEYFLEEVRKALIDRFGTERVYEGGLRVYATIDLAMQVAAENAVAASLQSLDQRQPRGNDKDRRPDEVLQAALIAIDPRTGYVRALVGGRNFAASRFDRATQAHRQPGSAFKPFVYAAALEAGYTQTSVIDHLDEPISTAQGAWLPDDEHAGAQSLDLRDALRVSSNRAAIRLLQQVGVSHVVRYANAFGLDRQPAVPSLALGSGEVTLASLTAAYAAFASGGLVRKPALIRHVDDGNGHVIVVSRDEPTRAISETTAFLMTDMLADVVNVGTASQARRLGFTLPAAGKTGTTNGFNDAWFIGYTPRLVVGVWVGFDMPHTIVRNGFAASVAVPLWAHFMSAVTRGAAPEWFEPPAGVVAADICADSGKLATDNCKNHRRQYFARGTQPIEYCDRHNPSLFRRVFGLVAGRLPQPTSTGFEPSLELASQTPDPTSSAEPDRTPTPAAPAKKRGFWWRLLH